MWPAFFHVRDTADDEAARCLPVAEGKRSSADTSVRSLVDVRSDKAQLEVILQSLGEGVVAMDRKGVITFVNAKGESLLGASFQEVLGKSFSKIWTIQDVDGHLVDDSARPIYRALATGKQVESKDYFYVRPNGERFPVAITATPVFLGRKIIGAVCVFSDISEEKRLDRVKSDFIRLTTHQLQTPLSTIRWYAERLLSQADGILNVRQRALTQEIQRAALRLIEHVNDLMNITRVELGQFSVASGLVDIHKELKRIIDDLRPLAEHKRLTIAVQVSQGRGSLLADPHIVRLIIENLITNAVQYTPKGGEVRVTSAKKGDRLLITVKDTGIGIPKACQKNIFTKFFRAPNARAAVPSGNGLGLFIVKTFVDAAKGKIWFTSQEKKGSTFYVELPLTAATAKRKVLSAKKRA